MGRVKDITGMVFNDWTVIAEYGRSKSGSATFLCRCACGAERIVEGRSIRTGTSKGCGCKRVMNALEASKKVTVKHGGRHERLYSVWNGMKDRCNNPGSKFYPRYGGRGIKVCTEWDESYATFREWATTHGYNSNATKYECTIERLDNNVGYSPDNCVWTTQKKQCNNRSSNHMVTFGGASHTLSEWSEITGIRKDTLLKRLCKYGRSVERALTELPRKYSRKQK